MAREFPITRWGITKREFSKCFRQPDAEKSVRLGSPMLLSQFFSPAMVKLPFLGFDRTRRSDGKIVVKKRWLQVLTAPQLIKLRAPNGRLARTTAHSRTGTGTRPRDRPPELKNCASIMRFWTTPITQTNQSASRNRLDVIVPSSPYLLKPDAASFI